MVGASRFLLASLALLAAPAAATDVWVVGPGLLDIGTAIDLASDGDIVLVNGTQPAFTVDSKSLVIVADPAGSVSVNGTVVVSNLAADQSVTLKGLTIVIQHPATAVRAVSNEGSLWIENCQLSGGDEFSTSPYPGLEAISSRSIVLRRSTITGGKGTLFDGAPGAPGVLLDDSTASAYACTVVGGRGGCGGPPEGCTYDPGQPGGAGVSLQGGFVLLVASTVIGGDGGCGDYCDYGSACGNGGDGGPGMRVDGGSSDVVETVLQGGIGGSAGCIPWLLCGCADGVEGPPFEVVQGSVSELPKAALLLTVDSPLREGQTWTATVFGEPDELVQAFASLGTAQLEPPSVYGFRLLAPPSLLLGSVTLPATGSAQFQGTVPELGPSIQGLPFYMQVVGLPPNGGPALGEAATVVLLDSAF